MAAEIPEVVTSTIIVKIFEQFQRVGLCLRARTFQRTCQQYHTTTPDTRKSNMAANNTEVTIFFIHIGFSGVGRCRTMWRT